MARLAGGLPRSLEHDDSDEPKVSSHKAELRALIATYDEGWADATLLGAVVKDPQIGLLDFYGEIDGRLVWLCWRHGEESVRYYHELEAGFGGRKPLRPDTRHRLLN